MLSPYRLKFPFQQDRYLTVRVVMNNEEENMCGALRRRPGKSPVSVGDTGVTGSEPPSLVDGQESAMRLRSLPLLSCP
jgi:hypothetical protein